MYLLMKKILFSIISFLFLVVWSCFAEDLWYYIKSYNVDMSLRDDGKLDIIEELVITYEEPSHWFFREIPYLYEVNDSTMLKTPITNIYVEWAEFEESKYGNYERLKIGSKNQLVNWDKTYKISYTVDWAVRNKEWWQELYWNVVGTDWDTSIRKLDFKLHLPENFEILDTYGRKWSFGSVDGFSLSLSWNLLSNNTSLKLLHNESATIAVKFPENSFDVKEVIVKKSLYRRFINFFNTEERQQYLIYSIYALCTIFIIWALSIIYRYFRREEDFYFKYRKDDLDGVKDVIYYDPPKWYLPWDLAVLRDFKSTTVVFPAMLYYWIGQWLIEVSTSGKRICFKKKESVDIESYQFQKYGEWKHEISPEKDYWDFCFGEKSTYYPTNALTSWKAKEVKRIADSVYYAMMNKFCPWVSKIFLYKNSLAANWVKTYGCKYSLSLVFSLFLAFQLRDFWFWKAALFPMWIAIGYVFLSMFIRSLRTKMLAEHLTDEGKNIIAHIYWFRKYLLNVEDDKLNTLINADSSYFEKILPYAVALWIWDDWIKKNMVFSELPNVDNVSTNSRNSFDRDDDVKDRHENATRAMDHFSTLRMWVWKSKLVGTITQRVHDETRHYNTDSGWWRGASSSSGKSSSGSWFFSFLSDLLDSDDSGSSSSWWWSSWWGHSWYSWGWWGWGWGSRW